MFSSQEFFVDNGAVPEKYVIKTAGGTIVSTGDIETQTSWTFLDDVKKNKIMCAHQAHDEKSDLRLEWKKTDADFTRREIKIMYSEFF